MNIIAQLEAEQIAALGKTIPDFKAGDTVKVGYKVTEGTRSRVQAYEGVVIGRKGGATISASFTVRKISFGEGVERVFPLYSTNIDSIEVVRRGRVRRAKLYYLRDRRGKSAYLFLNLETRPPVSSSLALPPVHAGCASGSMSSAIWSPSLPQVVLVWNSEPSVILTVIVWYSG